jgi:hypothetical protein
MTRFQVHLATRALVVVLASLSLASIAHADPERCSEEDRRDPSNAYRKGRAAYEEARYQDALDCFQLAYEVTASPHLACDEAQSYYMLQNYVQALHMYCQCDPSHETERAEIEARKSDLIRRLPGTACSPARPATIDERATDHREPGSPGRAAPLRLWGGISIGIAGGLLVAGVIEGVRAVGFGRDVNGQATTGQPFDPAVERRGLSAQHWETGLLVSGAVLAVTGGALYFIGGGHDPSSVASAAKRRGRLRLSFGRVEF